MTARILRRPVAALRWLTGRDQLTGVRYALALAGLVAGILAPVAAQTPLPAGIRAIAVLAFACVGPGAAVVSQLRVTDVATAWATTLVLSLATFAGVAVCMVWTDQWHPTAGFTALAWISALACLAGLAARGQPGQAGPGSNLAIPRQRAGTATDSTTVLPRVVDGATETTVMPIVPDDVAQAAHAAGQTAVLPKIVDVSAGRHTRRIPAARAGVPSVHPRLLDATAVLPKFVDIPVAADQTSVLPRFRDGDSDQTMVLPAVRDDPAPEAARRAAGGWYDRITPQLLIDVLIPAGIVAAWLLSVARTSTNGVDSYGLLFVMHPAFFVAVALCALGFVRELSRPDWRGWVLGGYIVLVVLVMHATVPLLLAEPEYAWVYKHLGVIDFIRTHGVVTNSKDIYQQWPTFFAAVAQLIAVSGVNPLRVAAWAPPFFDLANCLPVFAVARTVSANRRLPYLAVFLFSCVNWIGQDYLSPQAFAYLLALGCFMIMLRWLRRIPRATRRDLWLLRRLRAWVQFEMPEAPYTTARSRRLALVALYLIYSIIVISHQISPYIIATSATALVVLGLLEAWQVVPILGGIAASFLVTRYGTVDHYGLLSGLNFFHNAQGAHGNPTPSQPGQYFSSQVVRALALTVWGATGLTLLGLRRRLGIVAVPGVLAFAPMAILGAQNYGGEAIYRVYLFSVPWCVCVIGVALLRVRLPFATLAGWAGRALRAGRIGLATPVLAAAVLASMQGEHGQLLFDQFTPAEVSGVTYLYDHVPNDAVIMSAQSNMPDSITARYPDVSSSSGTLFGDGLYGTLVPPANGQPDLDAIEEYFSGLGGAPAFLLITTAMKHYGDYFGYLPPGFLDRVEVMLSASPLWRVWYGNADVKVYQYIG
jgi:hypothetical protein